jgi:hypothetical protein
MASKPWPAEHIEELRKHYPTLGASAMHRAGMCGGRSVERIRKTAVDLGLKIKPDQLMRIRRAAQLKTRDAIKKGPRELAIPKKKRVDSFREPEPRFASVWGYAQGVQA